MSAKTNTLNRYKKVIGEPEEKGKGEVRGRRKKKLQHVHVTTPRDDCKMLKINLKKTKTDNSSPRK